jgi:flagellar hook protein FlgE
VSANFQLFNTAVMGMSAQSDALANISENIANSNTVGFKRATTHFQTVLSGFQGAQQTGGGVSTLTRNDIDARGSFISTNSSTDLAIQGKGFFVVEDKSGVVFLTRAGSFSPDANGKLVNTAGYSLLGFQTDTNGNLVSGSMTAENMTAIQIQKDKLYSNPTTKGILSANLPASASIISPANLPSTNSPSAIATAKTSATVYDNLGQKVDLDFYYAKTAANVWEVTAYNAADAGTGGFPYANAALTSQTLSFDPNNGQLLSGSPVNLSIPNGSNAAIDMNQTTQLGALFVVNNLNFDGNAPGAVSEVQISENGALSYRLDNGQSINAFQLGIANVSAPSRLSNQTGNAYLTTSASGQMMIGAPGTGGFGAIQSSSLEASTVDLANELSAMIIAQRTFAANSQSFQVASEILQILNNLK